MSGLDDQTDLFLAGPERVLGACALHDAAQLDANVDHRLKQVLVGLDRLLGKELEHGHNLGDHTRFPESFPELLFLSHQLKGSGGSFGFPAITDVARRINEKLKLFLDQEQVPRPTPEAS